MYVALLLVGVANAAMQPRNPVYTSQKTVGPAPLAKSLDAPLAPATATNGGTPTAQAREGTATEMHQAGQQAAPAQNYLVYYYPDAYRNSGQTGVAPVYTSDVGFFGRMGWQDYGYILGTIILVGGGAALTYQGFGAQFRARALRSLQEMTYDDASLMARRVLRAIEKFQNLNNDQTPQ